MIGLLVDAAIAAVVVLDRLLCAVEKAARPQNPRLVWVCRPPVLIARPAPGRGDTWTSSLRTF